MSDLICRKSMMRCQTPGMCSPHGGCQDPVNAQLRAINFDYELHAHAADEEIARLKAENERLQRFETAYKEFSDKTDWVRPTATAQELGIHVADILHKRCDDLTSHNQAQADEIVRLRKHEPAAEVQWCACGDGYPVNSYGSGFMDANNGVCENCDAAAGGFDLRKDAERWRFVRNPVGNGSPFAIWKERTDLFLGKFADEAIDDAMAQEQQP